MSSLIQKPVLIAVRFMSITRSSIPVCINCTVLCASRVPPLCVTAAHSSPVPPAIVRDVPVLSLCRRLSAQPVPTQEQEQSHLLGSPAGCPHCMQLREKQLLPSHLVFL